MLSSDWGQELTLGMGVFDIGKQVFNEYPVNTSSDENQSETFTTKVCRSTTGFKQNNSFTMNIVSLK